MQVINLVSVLNAYATLDEITFVKYLNNFGTNNLREHELCSLKLLVQNIVKYIPTKDDEIYQLSSLDGYYVGYSIPQIGKEFDLLRFGVNSVVNVELKKESTEEKILKQLIRNQYYLSFLGRDIYCFTYVANEDKLYQLINEGDKDRLIEVDFSTLYDILRDTGIENITNIDALFNPTNYLVSPFNSTEKFIASEYFLTLQQEKIKSDIITWIRAKGDNFISLTGSAGTGKTLLIYDIAREFLQKKYQVLIIHCGNLNQGQEQLNIDYDWNIQRIKSGYAQDFEKLDLVIVDEVQRIYPLQLNTLIEKIKTANKKCIFSFDGRQCLSQDEINRKNVDAISRISAKTLKLTNKIRTNKEIADFIRQLFDKKINLENHNYPNVEISYFCNYKDAKSQLVLLGAHEWIITNYTPGIKTDYYYENGYSISTTQETPHSIIGQEFDNVVGIIDQYFFYNRNGELDERDDLWKEGLKKYYSQCGMLYQVLTRTRKKVHLVIINNQEILTRCLEVLGH